MRKMQFSVVAIVDKEKTCEEIESMIFRSDATGRPVLGYSYKVHVIQSTVSLFCFVLFLTRKMVF